ncbi:MAG: PolC-type DNA polymerase III [Clostridiales bacterium]|nr:PolC-type DNA polymerase III [Clostridiales bacterium]
MTEPQPFGEAFANFPMPGELSRQLARAVVTDISLSRERNSAKVSIESDRVLDERSIAGLREALIRAHSFDECGVSCRLNLPGGVSERLRAYWRSMVGGIGGSSPLSGEILSRARWSVDGERLSVAVAAGGAFFLHARRIDRAMETLISERLGINLSVRFEEPGAKGELSPPPKLTLPDIPPPPSPEPSPFPAQAPSPAGKRGGRKKTSVAADIPGRPIDLSDELSDGEAVVATGVIFASEAKETRTGKTIAVFDMTDGADSVTCKFFTDPPTYRDTFADLLKKGNAVTVSGTAVYDEYMKEVVVMPARIARAETAAEKRRDTAPEKRVELHLHTNMSKMDATRPIGDFIRAAKEWGHRSIAVTDHGVAQAFPDAMSAAKKAGIKMIYGIEAYLIDDSSGIVRGAGDKTLHDECVVFDIETTGLKRELCDIIEIGAVKIRGGEETARFGRLIDPGYRLPQRIVELTGITDGDLAGKPRIEDVLSEFLEFCGDAFLVAHNAEFDTGFVAHQAAKLGRSLDNAVLCTVELSRALLPEMPHHKLDDLTEHFGVKLEHHHRAEDDAAATARVFLKMSEMVEADGITRLADINSRYGSVSAGQGQRTYHAVILVKNQTGLRNLYELVSESHINHFRKRPRIPKSLFTRLREGLIIGGACEAGEIYQAVLSAKPRQYIDELAAFYDYYEIQPLSNNAFLIRDGSVADEEALRGINRKICDLGERFGKPVVATSDAHFLEPEDEIFRRIILAGIGYKDADYPNPLYMRTTDEMLAEFAYLGEAKAYEVVVTNTNAVADMIGDVKPIPDETFPPKIQGAEDEIRRLAEARAKELYGDPLPPVPRGRLERELTSIIKNGFSVMYIIAQKLVSKSESEGYLVGSRGSVGSSFAATMAGITEVNPLPPHYLCPNCKYSDFDSPETRAFAGASGCDMPDRDCPVCGAKLAKDGHDIPFETFLGFDGDKEPDIDLNFSGEYQAKAHAYTEELFGKGYVFKAGTIGTLADKTAYGYVRKYLEERGIKKRGAEINRLAAGCTGIKKTTGQHPGGLMIVPSDQSIYNFCPISRPADDVKSDVTTTHFDYHSISGRLLKLDLLGHDVPTIIRMLHDMTGVDPRTVDLGGKDVMSLFTGTSALGADAGAIGCDTGTLGLPEFGTAFVRRMLAETKPKVFSELVRISGLSHGTDVWNGNAQELIKAGTATLAEVIPTRDDIMVYLIGKGVEKLRAFKIMESVRKGKGLNDSDAEMMRESGVPEWYIESCRKIKYMFPKGHAVAYVMMTVRIGYFKIHYPAAFYAAAFSVRSDSFNYETMCRGMAAAKAEQARIAALGKDATANQQSMAVTLELIVEMYARGINFAPLDLYRSGASRFAVLDGKLLPPLCSIPGLGGSVAEAIVAERGNGEFISVEDLRERAKVPKPVARTLKEFGVLDGLSESRQLSFF